MKRISALAIALLAAVPCAAPRASAQDAAPAQTAAPAPELSPSHRAAAMELLQVMNMPTTLDESINTMMEIQLQANPSMRVMESVLRDFFRRHMTWDALKDGYAELYARTFTEDELRQMSAFYRTPAGQKLTRAMPQLMRAGAELGSRAVREHEGELRQMIVERLGRQEVEPVPPNRPGQPNAPAQPNRPGQPNPPIQPDRP
ncbi:MAG TPA: DUF2059 domain-containing protein [Longimicrobium sp.]|nr:DUF2059 domain-containing protein [Longimicrobium sp.]